MIEQTPDVQSSAEQVKSIQTRARMSEVEILIGSKKSALRRNRWQKLIFIALTAIIVILGLMLAYVYIEPKKLNLTVSPKGGPEQEFAEKLARMVAQNSRSIRINVIPEDTGYQALSRFEKGGADLVLARSDLKAASKARVLAMIETNAVILATPRDSKIKSIAGLKGKRIAVLSHGALDIVFARSLFSVYDIQAELYEAEPKDAAHLLSPGGAAAVLSIERRSQFASDKSWEKLAVKPGYDLIEFEGGKTIERRLHGATSDKIESGSLATRPKTPNEDIDGLLMHEHLLGNAKIPNAAAAQITQIIMENKDQLGVNERFALNLEPPNTDKDSHILAHPGSAEYVDGDVKSFFDKYSDLIYIGLSLGSIAGSVFIGLYKILTQVQPLRASDLIAPVHAIVLRARHAQNLEELQESETEIDDIVDRFVIGLQENAVSDEGFDGFRLATETARATIERRRKELSPGTRFSTTNQPFG